MAARKSIMTIRTYRITRTGRRIELARSAISQGEPYQREITGIWPDCACRRCVPPQGPQDENAREAAQTRPVRVTS